MFFEYHGIVSRTTKSLHLSVVVLVVDHHMIKRIFSAAFIISILFPVTHQGWHAPVCVCEINWSLSFVTLVNFRFMMQ